jgi:hypothetical protein
MRRRLFIAGIVVAALLLAGLGALISLTRSVISIASPLEFERSFAR